VRQTEPLYHILHMFDFHGEEVWSQCLHLPAHFSFQFILMSEMFSFKACLQWSTEVNITTGKLWAIWWIGKTFPAACRDVVYGIFGHAVHSSSSVPGPQDNSEYILLLNNTTAPEGRQGVLVDANTGPWFLLCGNWTGGVLLAQTSQLSWKLFG
jgi:hypothetical protein